MSEFMKSDILFCNIATFFLGYWKKKGEFMAKFLDINTLYTGGLFLD